MSETVALQRIEAQPPQEKKIALAQVVIHNIGSFEDTWLQVVAAWQKTFPELAPEPGQMISTQGQLRVIHAGPRQAQEISNLMMQLGDGKNPVTRDKIMADFGEKAYLLLKVDGKALGVVGWKVENLVACMNDIFLDTSLNLKDALQLLINEVERASSELQCEISLVFLEPRYANLENTFQALGYKEVIEYLDGKWSKEIMIEELKKRTRNFARRQMTWFKRFSAKGGSASGGNNVKWHEPPVDVKEILGYINGI